MAEKKFIFFFFFFSLGLYLSWIVRKKQEWEENEGEEKVEGISAERRVLFFKKNLVSFGLNLNLESFL